MNLHNDQGAFSQILIGFLEGATNDIDRNYDGRRLFGSNPIAFYSICDNIKLAIQGREPRTEIVDIPLGIFSSIITGINLQITIDELQGSLNDSNVEIILKDKLLNIEHDLKNTGYTFELSTDGTYDDRFSLIISESNVLHLDNFTLDNNLILIQNNNQLNIKTKDKKIISKLKVFDLLGRTMIDIEPNKNDFTINTVNFKNGSVILINIVFSNNQTLSKKTILLH